LFVAAMVGAGVFFGWWRDRDEARARNTLETELPKQNNIRVKSIDLRPVPPEEGGEKGDFTGTVTDEDGRVWDVVRVRVSGKRVEWFLREPEEKLRAWVADYVEKNLDAKVKSFDIRRAPDGRRLGKVTTTTGLELELEEEPTKTVGGQLKAGS